MLAWADDLLLLAKSEDELSQIYRSSLRASVRCRRGHGVAAESNPWLFVEPLSRANIVELNDLL